MSATKPPVPVRVGQIWADRDPRSTGRHVRIVEMDYRHAFVERVVPAGNHFLPAGGRNSRSRILFDDRGLRGYRLVADVENTTAPAVRTAAEDRAVLDHVASLRRVKLTLNADEIWALYRLLVAELSTDTPCLLPELHKEHEFAMGTALAKLSDAHLKLSAPEEGGA